MHPDEASRVGPLCRAQRKAPGLGVPAWSRGPRSPCVGPWNLCQDAAAARFGAPEEGFPYRHAQRCASQATACWVLPLKPRPCTPVRHNHPLRSSLPLLPSPPTAQGAFSGPFPFPSLSGYSFPPSPGKHRKLPSDESLPAEATRALYKASACSSLTPENSPSPSKQPNSDQRSQCADVSTSAAKD